MKKIIKNGILMIVGIAIVSCSDYLDVQPNDKYLEDQVFSSEDGVNSLLNGLYLSMVGPKLYGGNLTMSTIEVLGQRYNLADSRHEWAPYKSYSYSEKMVKEDMDAIWTSGYNTILNINNLLNGLEKQSVLTPRKKNIMQGEALGLRAMVHFDLLRLFGPIYSVNPSNLSIPYYKDAKAASNPLLPASELITHILSDLDVAASLLSEEDPIVSNGVAGDTSDFFYTQRNLRMNFYAVKALQARVNLYAGHNQAAFDAATLVIEATESVFPWTPPTEVITGNNPDRIFSSEVIFGIENLKLYEQQRDLFASELSAFNILAPNSYRLSETFENNENDYRYNSSWAIPTVGSYSFRTFFKYADVNDREKHFRFLQPLIRKTEMYYIASETAQDPAQALMYLNKVRYNRGLVALPETINIQNEILKEYSKEFYGEGQLFFYYKRKNASTIPDGSKTDGYSNITMGADQYVVPLPDSEAQFIN